MVAKHCRITGRVQGVGYRQAMQYMAENLGLTGWVRNRHDGSVEALVCGSEKAVTEILAWAKQGPRFSQVTELVVSEAECPKVSEFAILPTE
ncbi:MAG TPA: acylphosphatase [Methylophilaceae bacterium]|nr:acylphosphatase [Methylophilaceae bacterium]